VKTLFSIRIGEIELLPDASAVRAATNGMIRIALQHVCVSLSEFLVVLYNEESRRFTCPPNIDLEKLFMPSDGTLVELLGATFVAVENAGWRDVTKPFWEPLTIPDELSVFTEGRSRVNLQQLLSYWVVQRNSDAGGHGLAGGYDKKTDLMLLKTVAKQLEKVLPVIRDGFLYLDRPGGRGALKIETLKVVNGKLVCYRHIRKIAGGKLLVKAQVQVNSKEREDIQYEARDVLSSYETFYPPQYDCNVETYDQAWSPLAYIPDRIAPLEMFTGRASELELLAEWADDKDSRICLVHGDGGVGKTTLVVEFLHRLLEGNSGASWKPFLITFFTAKKTRWGLDGVEHISVQDIGVLDVVKDIARMLVTQNLDKSWYEKTESRKLVAKLVQLQKDDLKVSRDEHLIILDNTETMATSQEDIMRLVGQIKELRAVGKILVTSRRREQLEAMPIPIDPWSPEKGAEFLKKRGEMINCMPIIQAGPSRLKNYSSSLGNKPIVLEVFVQAAMSPGSSLEKAFEHVQCLQREGLGLFLYQDAWERLTPSLRHLLLLMSRVSDVLDEYQVQLCCIQTNVMRSSAEEALEESRGICSITRTQSRTLIQLSPEFRKFCESRWEVIDGNNHPTSDEIKRVKSQYNDFIKRSSAEVNDRNEKAYRVPFSRAAYNSFMEWLHIDNIADKKVQEGVVLDYYRLASEVDDTNGWLIDRFAHTLFKFGRLSEALEKSSAATRLVPDDPEAWFTKGMIEARLGKGDDARVSLYQAEANGKPPYLCALQRAYSYVLQFNKEKGLARKEISKAEVFPPYATHKENLISEIRLFRARHLD